MRLRHRPVAAPDEAILAEGGHENVEVRLVGFERGPEGTAQDEGGQSRRGNDELPHCGADPLTQALPLRGEGLKDVPAGRSTRYLEAAGVEPASGKAPTREPTSLVQPEF